MKIKIFRFNNSIITFFIVFLLTCSSALALDITIPDKKYRNVLVLENNLVYGVLNVKSENGKYLPIELTGVEKIKVVLHEFTMKDEVTIEKLKSDKLHKKIVEILFLEKSISIDLLKEWTKKNNVNNNEKANYLLNSLLK